MVEIDNVTHTLLKRQLEKSLEGREGINLPKLLKFVNESYEIIDQERYLTDRSIHVMSDELTSVNRDLLEQAQNLKRIEERYALAAKGANDGLWDWDIETDKCFYSARWLEIIGYSEEEKFETIDDWLRRIHSSHQQSVKTALYKHLEGTTERFEAEYQIKTKSGNFVWVLTRGIAARNSEGKAIRIAGSQTDISQRKKYEEQLFKAAFHDKLTGLPNRALFIDRLKHCLKFFKRSNSKRKAALLFLDLDRFKVVNDSLGHEAGDQLLVAVTRRLELIIRPSDTLCRLGGDEFTLLLENIDDEQHASVIANRLIEELHKPFFIYNQQIFISGSIGIVIIDSYEDPENLMRNADLAMYQAKSKGKSRAEIFEKRQYDAIYTTLQTETDMRRGIERKEFIPFFQPIVAMNSGEIVCLEALMRWNHAEKGILTPSHFIDLAEETGVIKNLSEILLQNVCKHIKMWGHAFGKKWMPEISINLSAKQIYDPKHMKVIFSMIEKAKVDPKQIVFEITETTIMSNAKHAGSCFKEIKERGFSLAIDDFGTGHSSLSYLSNYPFDKLKIDRSFVTKVSQDLKKQKLIKHIIGLAKDLGMMTIAEGVESASEVEKLLELGCECVQGFYFATPMNADETLNHLLSDQNFLYENKKENLNQGTLSTYFFDF